jgi:hypothetical protein
MLPGTIWRDKILNMKEIIWEKELVWEDNIKIDIIEQVV